MIARFLYCAAAVALCSCTTVPPPATVSSVDLNRYAGEWFEVEAIPNWFQRGCTGSRANYKALADGAIRVVNTCMRKGRIASIQGTARAVPGSRNSKLKVQFFWPFKGDYWVIDLDKDYRWAVVGDPRRKYLWILSRAPQLPAATLGRIRARAAAQGYDVSRLRPTPSPENRQLP